jgi:hypothetical protein
MPAAVGTQRAGNKHDGPLAVSHALPSAAGATHVPIRLLVDRWHVAPVQRVSTPLTTPHGWLAVAVGCITHSFVVRSHVKPDVASQSGPVTRRASHVAPFVVTSRMHVPIADVVAPTHARPTPHGNALEQALLMPIGTWHCCVVATHTMVGPQSWAAHESPAAGAGAHVPHSCVGEIAQNPVAHSEANEHAAPTASGPDLGKHTSGGLTPERNTLHASATSAPPHVSTSAGVAAVFGAASASRHDSFSRVSQVGRSPQRRDRSASEQAWSCVHRSSAMRVQAWSAVTLLVHPNTNERTTNRRRTSFATRGTR